MRWMKVMEEEWNLEVPVPRIKSFLCVDTIETWPEVMKE